MTEDVIKVRLLKPRWPGGPKICPAANLPAFETMAGWRAFHAKNGPSCKVIREWICDHCGHWHAETTAPDPTGGSSGQGRSSKGGEPETLWFRNATAYERWLKEQRQASRKMMISKLCKTHC